MAFAPPVGTSQWVKSSIEDYFEPQQWKPKEQHKECRLEKKLLDEDAVAFYKLSGPIDKTTLDALIAIVWNRANETAKELNSSTVLSTFIEQLSRETREALGVDEGRVVYQQSKLPVVDDRDFVTMALKKEFKNPKTNRRCVGMFSKSVDHPKAPPVPKGCTRANVLQCCAFVEETPTEIMYTYTQQCDIHPPQNAASIKVVQSSTKSHLHEFFGKLTKLAQKN